MSKFKELSMGTKKVRYVGVSCVTAALGCAWLFSGLVLAQTSPPAEPDEDSLIRALYVAPAAVRTTEGARTRANGVAASAVVQAARVSGSGEVSLSLDLPLAGLTLRDKARLDILAQAMRSDDLAGTTFRIEALTHVDDPVASRQPLALARAQQVLAYLVQEQNILPERLQAAVALNVELQLGAAHRVRVLSLP
jgi:hypothetical protein